MTNAEAAPQLFALLRDGPKTHTEVLRAISETQAALAAERALADALAAALRDALRSPFGPADVLASWAQGNAERGAK